MVIDAPRPGPRPRFGTSSRAWLNALAWIPVVLFVEHHVVSFATVSGRSMQPTLNPDSSELRQDIVLLNRYKNTQLVTGSTKNLNHPDHNAYKIGDIVALRSPTNPSQLIIKRLIGLPGSLIRTLPPFEENTIRIPKGHCWIEGDEKNHSKDSNTYGPVPLGLLDSKVELIVWPLRRIGQLSNSNSGWEKRVVHPPSISVAFGNGRKNLESNRSLVGDQNGHVRIQGGGL